jgi:hypothetical protein
MSKGAKESWGYDNENVSNWTKNDKLLNRGMRSLHFSDNNKPKSSTNKP